MTQQEKIQRLSRLLFPTGRAFKFPPNGVMDKIIKALSVSEDEALEAVKSIKDSLLPDNPNFSVEDASDWERRLGLISNPLVPIEDRKLAIKRKMNHPGNIPARQHYLYIEKSLQDAGFDVWVHENIPEITPQDYIATGTAVAQHGDFNHGELNHGDATEEILSDFEHGSPLQHGMVAHGGNYNNQIANSIYPHIDFLFNHGDNFRSSFFIGGQDFGTFANVNQNRESEFRELVISLKPQNTISYIYINYI